MKKSVPYLDLKKEIISKIKKNGGWVNAHAHIDRAFSINKNSFKFVNASLQQKWELNNELKETSTVNDIYNRMALATERMIEEGVTALGTFIDVDQYVKDKAIKAAQKLRDTYKNDLKIVYINQVHYGVFEPKAREWFDIAVEFVDIVGGLPESDKEKKAEHIDILLDTAKQMKKMAHVHIDQFHDPKQKDTELLAKKTIEHGMEGKVVGIHGVSIPTHPKEYRKKLYDLMKKAKLMMVVSPTAMIDFRRNEVPVPFHNSLLPVDELVPEGITIGLGTDNIADIYKPFSTGEMWQELYMLFETMRYYEVDELIKIATVNGRKTLGLA